MSATDGLMEVAGIILAALVLAAFGIWRAAGFPLGRSRQPDPKPEPKPDDGLRQCRGCGDTFHKSWGSMCPNCTGAD